MGSIEGALIPSRGIGLIPPGGIDLISSGGMHLIPSEGIRDLIQRYSFDLVRRRWLDRIFQQSFKVFFDLPLTLLMAKKDMHTYVSRLKDTELDTLISTYDIPLDLKPRLPDPNFRMINLPARDTATGIYSRIFDTSGVRIPFSSFLLPVLKYLKVHISQLVPLGNGTGEPHGLDSSILGRVADRTTTPASVSSSEQAARDEVEQTDDGTLDDDDQCDSLEFAMEGIENLNDVSQDKEVKAHAKLSGGVRRATQASFYAEDASLHAQEAMPAPNTQPLDADAGEITSDDLLPFVPGSYYIPYPYDERSGSESPPYTKDDWEEIHGVNLGLRKKELYKDPKVCRTALDRFPTPSKTHRLRELSLVELSDRFPAQSVRSSNAIALDSPYLLVLITRTSQSRQHGKSESDSYYLSD
nr:hypothetical protein [Tanacetum cinerariifolium]